MKITRFLPVWFQMVNETNSLKVGNLTFRSTRRVPQWDINLDVILTILIVTAWAVWG